MPLQQQKGVALLFVMVIFAVITIIATSIVTQTQRNTIKQVHYLQYQQTKQYAFSGEQYIAALLEKNQKNTQQPIDHWFLPWAEDHHLSLPTGEVEIQVIDEQALFNINLLRGQYGSHYKPMFDELLTRLHINTELTNRIASWGQKDPQSLTAEDNFYLSLQPATRAGGERFVSVSELKIMQFLDEENYEKLRPFITALPDNASININTVPRELIPVILPGVSEGDAEEIIAARGKIGFANLESLKSHPALVGKNINWSELPIHFASQYFSAYIKAQYGEVTYHLHSLLMRDRQGKVAVISREERDSPQWVSVLRRSMRQQ